MLSLLILLTERAQNALKRKLWKNHVKLQRKPVNGIKGPSWFSGLKHHDIIDGMGIDYIHCVLLSICKRLLRLWFDSGETADYKINSRIARWMQDSPPLSHQIIFQGFLSQLKITRSTLKPLNYILFCYFMVLLFFMTFYPSHTTNISFF